ncbi:MAG: hypothetical protein VX209_04440 [Thermoproteota archaeon]|jgi:hypothetical protein|nr:hypothetical protein [Thermoproteota archaeon]
MEHNIFYDGNVEKFSWVIETGKQKAEQIRTHPPAYYSGYKLDIKNNDESKFVALHVAIYWGLGVFLIKNNDILTIMCDTKKMYDILTKKQKTNNQIIDDKMGFIKQLTDLRNLDLNYKIINSDENFASKLLK